MHEYSTVTPAVGVHVNSKQEQESPCVSGGAAWGELLLKSMFPSRRMQEKYCLFPGKSD